MSVVTEKLTRARFRELYADQKPNFELIDGRAEQKALGANAMRACKRSSVACWKSWDCAAIPN
jgi:hypothetical protein